MATNERFIVYTYNGSTNPLDDRNVLANSRPNAVIAVERGGRRPSLKSRDTIRRFLEGEMGKVCVSIWDEFGGLMAAIMPLHDEI